MAAINPARDFGPRLWMTVAGWGSTAIPAGGYWWVPIAGPLFGAVLAGLIYDGLVRTYLAPAADEIPVADQKAA